MSQKYLYYRNSGGIMREFKTGKFGVKFPRFHQLKVGERFFFKRGHGGGGYGLTKIEPEEQNGRVVNAEWGHGKIYVRPLTPTVPPSQKYPNQGYR